MTKPLLAHPGARRPDQLGGGAARAPGERAACHALPGSPQGGAQQRPRSCRRCGYRGPARERRLLGLAAQRRGSGDEREAWRPDGERLGWIRKDDLLLDPDAAFAAAQKLARDQGTSIPIKQRTLWKRLDEQGLLASRDQARGSTVRLTIQGMRRDLLHLRTSTLAAEAGQSGDETGQRDETGQEKGPESRGLPGSGQFGQFGQKTET